MRAYLAERKRGLLPLFSARSERHVHRDRCWDRRRHHAASSLLLASGRRRRRPAALLASYARRIRLRQRSTEHRLAEISANRGTSKGKRDALSPRGRSLYTDPP